MKKPFDCLTDLVFVNQDQLELSDIILVPGGSHPQLIERAVELYQLGLAPYILPSGGYNSKINQTEWKFLNEIAIKMGVPQEVILKEDQARNTFDNARNSWKLIEERNIKVRQVIMVCKAQHSRRALMTYQTVFPLDIRFLMEPISDKNNITRDNWFQDEMKIKAVMGEAEKISKYFVHHIPYWI
ncbi:YdcF family protein [Paenibacillus puldeungensis]|uniref:YdcF family protein n=1 Tax=Paenibacillus puldeungensis TaxID=696536 RepID=A0ABW3RW82_9BACL